MEDDCVELPHLNRKHVEFTHRALRIAGALMLVTLIFDKQLWPAALPSLAIGLHAIQNDPRAVFSKKAGTLTMSASVASLITIELGYGHFIYFSGLFLSSIGFSLILLLRVRAKFPPTQDRLPTIELGEIAAQKVALNNHHSQRPSILAM